MVPGSPIVVTGANGFVGARVCAVLSQRDIPTRAVVRRAGTAPALPGVTELVGDFTDLAFAAQVVTGAAAVVTTVHPMGSARAHQEAIGVRGTTVIARAAAAAGVRRIVHISTAAVYDRSPGVGDVDEHSALVGDDADDYAVTKRETERALAAVEGITRVLLRPPAILGPGPTSIWNTLRPASLREDPHADHPVPEQTFPWVHVADLASLTADLAAGPIADAPDADPEHGPVAGACVPVNVGGSPATLRDYWETVGGALAIEPAWGQGPAWTGALVSDRAHRWGWSPTVDLTAALDELAAGLIAAA